MITAKYRRIISEKVLLPLGKKLNINPDWITALTYPLALGAALALWIDMVWVALLLFVLSALVDVLDGAVAKANKRASAWGSYWDAMTDRWAELIILMGFALKGYSLSAGLSAALSLMVSYAKARAEMVKPLGNVDWPSVAERSERLLVIALAFVCEGMRLGCAEQLLWLLAILSAVGVIQRMLYARALLLEE